MGIISSNISPGIQQLKCHGVCRKSSWLVW